MDKLDAMKLFVRVAELGTFAAAAKQQNIARSVVTRQIATLEHHLGCLLLIRTTRSLTLTAAGSNYLLHCKNILSQVELAENEVRQEKQNLRGSIRLSVPLNYGLLRVAPLLLEFAQTYPDVTLDVDYSDQRKHLVEEGFDLAIRITQQPNLGEVARKIGEIQIKTIAAPSYLAQYGMPQHPDQLREHRFLGYSNLSTRSLNFWVDQQLHQVNLRPCLNANNGEFLTQAARMGLGIACQPDFLIDSFLEKGELVELLQNYPLPTNNIYAVRPQQQQTQRVKMLNDFLVRHLEKTRIC